MSSAPLWTPSPERIRSTALDAFREAAEERAGRQLSSYRGLHAWSVEDRESFWDKMWDAAGIIGKKGAIILENDKMPGARFFPEAELNFAENLLRRDADGDAIVFWGEDKVRRRLSWADLHALVSRMQQAFRAAGVGVGDRVAAMLPNMPETIAAMLATASIGAVWSSCSPDFGEQGVVDRFGQIEPKIFLCVDGYFYGGKRIDMAAKLKPIIERLPSVEQVLVVEYVGTAEDITPRLPKAKTLEETLEPFAAQLVEYECLPFNHPLFILFSSGTTGVPKCIVHSAGGALIQLLKEHILHCDVGPGDRVFYFTTCGWMMWNWLVTALGTGSALLLYDGSPFHPSPSVLFDYAQAEGMTLFGASAKYIDGLRKAGLKPKDTHNLDKLRTMTSTGSPLSAENFEYVYGSIKEDLHLASISGGTDIVSCFVLGVPTEPVYAGEIQGPGLGLAVDVWNDRGERLLSGKGELVCTKAFPSMPLKFWNDPDGKKYRAAYFERFPGVWHHGDFAEWTAHDGLVIHGRSDATLNPGGVRIGTAEIYAQVERIPEVMEALAIGQEWDNDIRIVLFVRLGDRIELDDKLRERITKTIREGASPRHVPAKIVAVDDIPRTKSGKITELAVREMVHGRPVENKEALANPEALELYKDIGELRG